MEEAVSDWLRACPCSFQVSSSALALAKVTAVSAAELAPDAPLHPSLERGQDGGERRRRQGRTSQETRLKGGEKSDEEGEKLRKKNKSQKRKGGFGEEGNKDVKD